MAPPLRYCFFTTGIHTSYFAFSGLGLMYTSMSGAARRIHIRMWATTLSRCAVPDPEPTDWFPYPEKLPMWTPEPGTLRTGLRRPGTGNSDKISPVLPHYCRCLLPAGRPAGLQSSMPASVSFRRSPPFPTSAVQPQNFLPDFYS